MRRRRTRETESQDSPSSSPSPYAWQWPARGTLARSHAASPRSAPHRSRRQAEGGEARATGRGRSQTPGLCGPGGERPRQRRPGPAPPPPAAAAVPLATRGSELTDSRGAV